MEQPFHHCLICGKKYFKTSYVCQKQWEKSKFCSYECFYSFRIGKKWKRFNCKCLICGKEFHVKPSHIKTGEGKYCSYSCSNIRTMLFQSGENHPNWNGGEKEYSKDWNLLLKEKVRDRDLRKCQVCGIPEIETCKRLDIHHVDYNKKNCSEDNLISLCVPCHRKTNYNREMWKDYLMQQIKVKNV